jgi:cephalosporin hydroxylase
MDLSLKEIFNKNNERLIYKWEHYFDIYENHFSKFQNSKKGIKILEIGILHGGSLQMWSEYFGPNATIVGIDIYEDCKKFEEKNIKIRIGSQADPDFLRRLVEEFGNFDIILDDGSHRVFHQKVTFTNLYKSVNNGGVYMVEDTHSNYWLDFGGGNRRMGTFIEYSKTLIDQLHAWYSEERSFKVDVFTQNIGGIHYYDSIVVFDKKEILTKPITVKSGKAENENRESKYSDLKRSYFYKIGIVSLKLTNRILRFFKLPALIFDGKFN